MTDSTFTIQQNTVNGLVSTLDGKASVDLSNSPYTTNRIIEIPQDIKLELSNGTLTVKAGSKVRVPNGVDVFDEITTTQDGVVSFPGQTPDCLIFRHPNGGFTVVGKSQCFSGGSAPSGQTYMMWFDTTNGLMKFTSNSGSTWTSGYSLPLGICQAGTSNFTSIDQVFNGFGYIGLVAFALPGIKIQYVQGTNIDGTYNTGVATTTSMLFVSLSANYPNSRGCLLSYSPSTQTFGLRMAYEIGNMSMVPSAGRAYSFMFCEQDGWFYVTENTTTYSKSTQVYVKLGWFYQKSATEASVKIDTVNTVNTYSRSELSGIGAQSSKFETWTIGASDSFYTAPANGYIYIDGYPNAAIYIIGRYSGVGNASYGPAITCRVRKGETVQIRYTGNMNALRFYYAEGEV